MKREIIDRDTNIKLKFTADNQDVKNSINQLLAGLKEIQTQTNKEGQISLGKGIKEFRKEITQSLPISKDLQDSIAKIQEDIQAAFGTDTVNKFNTMLLGTNSTISQTATLADRLSNADLSKVFNTMFNVGAMMAAYHGIKRVTSALSEFSKESINFVETKNLFDVSMGNGVAELSEYYDRAIKFQNELGEKLSINTQESMNYQALFNAMSKSMGIAAGEAYKLSENFTKLGYDLASLYNIDPTAAMDKLRAGLAGQTKPLRDLGLDITQQSLTPIAQDLGIDRSVKNMSQAEKMILRYIAVLRQASLAQGDFARTMETPANQMRIFNSQITILKRNVGNLWSGMLTRILPYVNAVLMVINELLKMLGAFFGFSVSSFSGVSIADEIGADDAAADLGGATAAAKEFKKQLMGFDEIHNIELPDTSSGGGGGGGGGGNISGIDQRLLDAMKDYDNMMANVRNKATDIRDKIMDWLGFTKIINPETGEITWQLRDGLQNIEKILDVVKAIGIAFAAWKISSSIMKVISTLGWVGKEKALSVAANLTLAITGIFVQYQGTKHLLEGDIDTFSLIETLLGTTAGTFGIAKLLNTATGMSIGKSIAIGLGLMITIQSLQVMSNAVDTKDLKKAIIGGLEAGLGAGILLATTGAGLTASILVGLTVTGISFVLQGAAMQDVDNYGEKISTFLKNYKDFAKQLDEQKEAIIKSVNLELGSIGNVSGLVDELETLVDENGKVKEGYEDRVNYILGEVNSALGTEIGLVDGVIDNYDEQIKKIREMIEVKKAEVWLDANKEAYANVIKTTTEALQREKEAEEAVEGAKKNVDYWLGELTNSYGSLDEARKVAAGESDKYSVIEQQNARRLVDDYDMAQKAYDDLASKKEDTTNRAIDASKLKMYYEDLEAALSDGNTEKITENLEKLQGLYIQDGQVYSYSAAEQLETSKFLADQKIKENERQGKTITAQDKEQANATYNRLVKSYAEQLSLIKQEELKKINEAKASGDAQIAEYERQGITITDDMRKSAYEQYNVLKDNLTNQLDQIEGATPEQKEAWKWLMENDKETFQSVLEQFAGGDNTVLGDTLDAMSNQLDSDTKVETSTKGLADRQYKAMNKVGDYDTLGSDTGDAYRKGLDSQKQAVAYAADQIAEETKKVNSNSGSMWGWGYDMIQGLANGIRGGSGWGVLGSAVNGVVNTIKSYLHFSKPDKGDLRDYETWMPDMMKGLASSMEKATPIMETATAKLASGISEELQNMYINPDDYKLKTETDINQIVDTKVTIDSNLPELFYNAIVNGMNDSSVQVNVQARTDKGVIFEVVQEEANNFYNSTGEAPFPVM